MVGTAEYWPNIYNNKVSATVSLLHRPLSTAWTKLFDLLLIIFFATIWFPYRFSEAQNNQKCSIQFSMDFFLLIYFLDIRSSHIWQLKWKWTWILFPGSLETPGSCNRSFCVLLMWQMWLHGSNWLICLDWIILSVLHVPLGCCKKKGGGGRKKYCHFGSHSLPRCSH